jgi:hypothetical protein
MVAAVGAGLISYGLGADGFVTAGIVMVMWVAATVLIAMAGK